MPFDHDPDDERSLPDGVLPPDDRLWRHPSELGGRSGATPRPSPMPALAVAGVGVGEVDRPSRVLAVGLVLVGVVVTAGALWLTRGVTEVAEDDGGDRSALAATGATAASLPTSIATGSRFASTTVPVVAAQSGAGTAPTDPALDAIASSVAVVEVERDGTWERATALWVDDGGTLAAPASLLSSAGTVYVIGDDGRRQLARVLGTDPATGIAALSVARTAGTPVAATHERPAAGTSATVVGADDDDPSVTMIDAVSARAVVGDDVYHDALHLDRPGRRR